MLYTDGVIEGGPDSPDSQSMARALGTGAGKAELLCSFYQDAVRELSDDRDDITLFLLERGEGVSHFDDTPPAEERQQPEPASTPPQLLQGSRDDRAFIAVTGSITWLVGQALLDCARRQLDQHHRLTIDLDNCHHMDSTCLGTLHEIVKSNPEAVDLQCVGDEVRGLFDELNMSAVLEHISPEAAALPEQMTGIHAKDLSPQQQGARILSAHETLASLSPENEEQFRSVVDSLRVDLHRDD